MCLSRFGEDAERQVGLNWHGAQFVMKGRGFHPADIEDAAFAEPAEEKK